MPIRLALAGERRSVLDRLTQICSLERDFEVVAQATTGKQALRAVQRYCPDILVLDMRITDTSAPTVLRRAGGGSFGTRSVILIEAEGDSVLEAIRLGACGVVPSDMAPTLLVKCIREVHAGGKWFERDFAVRTLVKLAMQNAGTAEVAQVLSRRELDVAHLAGKGMRNAHIAKKLSITEGTAKLHLHNVYEKLKLSRRAGRAPRWALKEYLQAKGLG